MLEYLSIIVPLAVALAAVISPIFVAIINNHHNYKIRQMELQHDISMKELTILYENKRNAFSNFLTNAGKVCTDEAHHDVEQDFYGYAQLAILFASNENQKLISQFTEEMIRYLNEGIPQDKYSYFLGQISKISVALNYELTSLNSLICNHVESK